MYGVVPIDPAEFTSALSTVDVVLLAIPLGVRRPYIEAAAKCNKARARETICREIGGTPLLSVAICTGTRCSGISAKDLPQRSAVWRALIQSQLPVRCVELMSPLAILC